MEADKLKNHYALKTAIGIIFTLAVIGLFQFIAVQLLLAYFGDASLAHAQTIPVQAAAKPAPIRALPLGLPVRLKIPNLKVNALIRYVGLTKTGAMGVPAKPSETAWYMLGTKPGEKGSAVIAGHVNWWNGVKGVFQNLKKLKPGDKMTIEDDRGKITTFVVRKIREYGQKEDASEVFLSDDGKAHLNLVTCTGVWDRLTQAYTKRLVVFADKVVE